MAERSATSSDRSPGQAAAESAGTPGRAALPAVASLLLFAALALFGARYHWLEQAGSAERDGYVAQAETILAGELPRDPYRPALYPLAVAALARLGLAPFTAARLLANLAAVALAGLAFFFARRLAGPPAGWLAWAATAANPNLWILGQHVTTDMPFAALAAGALAAGLVYLERPGWRPALAAGACLGLAAFTRANAWFLLPALAAAWVWAPRGGAARISGRRLAHLGAGAAAAVLLVAPHFALRYAVFGNPFHDENWKNLAWKLYGFPDWSYLDRVPFAGPWDLLTANPGAVLRGGVEELGRFFFGGGLSQLVGTPLHALLLGVGLVALLGAGRGIGRGEGRDAADEATVAEAARSLRRRTLWLLFAAATFLLAVAFTFFAWGRLLLCLLPVANAVAFAPWGEEVRRAWRGTAEHWTTAAKKSLAPGSAEPPEKSLAPRMLAVLPVVLALLVVAPLVVKTAFFRLPAFVAEHAYGEVAALRELAARTPPDSVLAGVSPFLGRYLDDPSRYLYVPDAFGEEVDHPDLYYRKLHRLLAEAGATYLVVGPVDLRDRPGSLLLPREAVPGLRDGESRESGVVVWRVAGRG